MPNPVTATIGVIGSIGSSAISSRAAGKAAKAQTEGYQQGIDANLEMYYNSVDLQKPWIEGGKFALNKLIGTPNPSAPTRESIKEQLIQEKRNALSQQIPEGDGSIKGVIRNAIASSDIVNAMVTDEEVNAAYAQAMKDFEASGGEARSPGLLTGGWKPEESPGYEFGFNEFVANPLNRKNSATGRVRSPAADKELTRYAMNYADTQYQNALSPWFQLAGLGSTASGRSSSDAIQTGGNLMSAYSNMGDARGSAYINRSNAITSPINNLTEAFTTYQIGKS